MNKSIYAFLLLIIVTFFSCETDIDVNAEYKDIPVVYGIINPQDSVHYIKVTKAFLGEISALDLAADANNFNYAAGELDVVVEERNNDGALIQSYSLTRTVNEVPKDPGVFDNSDNVLYKFIEPSINRGSNYSLKIINSSLSKEITAQTEIVSNTVVSNPPNTNGKFQFWIGAVSSGAFNPPREIRVTSGQDVGRIQATLVFNYIDHYTTASGKNPVSRRVLMDLGEIKTTSPAGGEAITWELKGETFFDNIASGVPASSTIADFSHRELDNISLEFLIAGNELSTYMEVSAPSSSVNQDKPNYTNLSEGVGIFSSREKLIWLSSINPQTSNQVNIQNNTISYLATHATLIDKGFCFGTTGVGFPVAPCTQQ